MKKVIKNKRKRDLSRIKEYVDKRMTLEDKKEKDLLISRKQEKKSKKG